MQAACTGSDTQPRFELATCQDCLTSICSSACHALPACIHPHPCKVARCGGTKMRYTFETLDGKSFELHCDPHERLHAILQRAALDNGCDVGTAFFSFNGKKLGEQATLSELDLNITTDVIMFHGSKEAPKGPAEAEADDATLVQSAIEAKKAEGNVASLEEVRDRVHEQQEAQSRPKFVSKKKRDQLKRQAKEEGEKAAQHREEELQRKRQAAFEEAKRVGQEQQDDRVAKKARTDKQAEEEADPLDAMKARYLGGRPAKKIVRKRADLAKVPDTWDAGDDTSKGAEWGADAPLAPLFGRGFLGGSDIDMQLTERGGVTYEEMLEQRDQRELQAKAESQAKRRQNIRAAEQLESKAQEGGAR
eukprot:TRINITY_DN2789_c0_g1_i1.p1 TRINITY_DN2789_c0_g1~~TRINITY_DN2789_c0_g1_i1.p1  ORF type:complete len:363 (+),score=130.63 TRINITY_DN2789_c0_g1_i1:1617-2705(+)